ncbi:MAG TPA: YdeI/OmpD-associated family protein [Puia sp.]|nr:YdeI/OmpD-associated family protein [Puia sp.]
MPNTVAQKLKIKDGYILLTINAPSDFKRNIGLLPSMVKISDNAKNYNQIHWFVLNKKQMDKELTGVLELLKENVLCWIYYPKGTSKMQTDLTRDKGWEELLKHEELQWVGLISFDETWSTFACRLKKETDKIKAPKTSERPIFDYINTEKKTVRLPKELTEILRKNKKANEFFQTLSFTNKKEYVEWIITAKREETKNERLSGSVERLNKGWKNPRNM